MFLPRRLFLAAFAGMALAFSGPMAARAEEKPKLVLITQSKGFEHSAVKNQKDGKNHVQKTWEALAEKTGLFTVEHSKDVTILTPEKLKETKIIVFVTTGSLPFSAEGFKNFEQWLKDGGAFMGMHCATDTMGDHPVYPKIVGGTFNGHPWNAGDTVTIKVQDKKHPATKPFGDSYTLKDEIYQFKNFVPGNVRVLISLDMEKTALKKPYHVPICWVREYEKGRVFYTSLGHREDVWTNPLYQDHIIAGMKWATKQVEGDATPNPEVDAAEKELAAKAVAAQPKKEKTEKK